MGRIADCPAEPERLQTLFSADPISWCSGKGWLLPTSLFSDSNWNHLLPGGHVPRDPYFETNTKLPMPKMNCSWTRSPRKHRMWCHSTTQTLSLTWKQCIHPSKALEESWSIFFSFFGDDVISGLFFFPLISAEWERAGGLLYIKVSLKI